MDPKLMLSKLIDGVKKILYTDTTLDANWFTLSQMLYELIVVHRCDVTTKIDCLFISHFMDLAAELQNLKGVELLQAYQSAWRRNHESSKCLEKIFKNVKFFDVVKILKNQWNSEVLMESLDHFVEAICDIVFTDGFLTNEVDTMIVHLLQCYGFIWRSESLFYEYHEINQITYLPHSENEDYKAFKKCFTQKTIKKCNDYCANYKFSEWPSYDDLLEHITNAQVPCDHIESYYVIFKPVHAAKTVDIADICKGTVTLAFLKHFDKMLPFLFRTNDSFYLARFYALCSGFAPAVDHLRDHFQRLVEDDSQRSIPVVSMTCVHQTKAFINAITELRMKHNQFIYASFDSDKTFHKIVDMVFTKLVNNYGTKPVDGQCCNLSRALARYSDYLLSKSSNANPEADARAAIEHLLTIVNYLSEKDAFIDHYHKFLVRRLIYKASIDDETEAFVIGCLKKDLGCDATRKLQTLYNDCQKSRERTTEFKKFTAKYNFLLSGINLSVTVIKQNVWPLEYNVTTLVIPRLNAALNVYNMFYQSDGSYKNRKLSFIDDSYGEVVCNCFARKYSFIANVHQTGILIMFNNVNNYTLQKMLNILNIPLENLIAILTPMLKVGILQTECEIITSATPLDTQIRLNLNFECGSNKINIVKHVKKVATKEDAVTRNVVIDYSLGIQAAIVRIMKPARKMPHKILVAEVMKVFPAHFKLNVRLIKDAIADLMVKEMIVRDQNKWDVYVYTG